MLSYPHPYPFGAHTSYVRILMSVYESKKFPTILRQIHHHCLLVYIDDRVNFMPFKMLSLIFQIHPESPEI